MQKQITMTKTITIKNGTTINYDLAKCTPSKNGIALSWRRAVQSCNCRKGKK